MKTVEDIKLSDVVSSWSGNEWRFWPEFFGEQLHIGGLRASKDLADKAGIQPGSNGVEFCCGTGGASRFLIRFRNVANVQAVDVSEALVNVARERTREEGFLERINFTVSDVSNSGLPSGRADFVWGEDAWVYVPDKTRLVAEAVRVLRPGGTIAFLDWCEGSNLSDQEAERFMRYHNFRQLPVWMTIAHFWRMPAAIYCEWKIPSGSPRDWNWSLTKFKNKKPTMPCVC